MDYAINLCKAEEELFRLDEELKLSPELLHCLYQIITIAVNNYANSMFRLPKELSLGPIDKQYDEEIKHFLNSTLIINKVISIEYSITSTDIILG